jgi:hypothetical protein
MVVMVVVLFPSRSFLKLRLDRRGEARKKPAHTIPNDMTVPVGYLRVVAYRQ